MSAVSLKDCTSPWDWLAIDSAGFARCCCHSRGLIGNLNEMPFDEVWNGDGMLKLRHAVSEDRFALYCKGAACQFALNKQSAINRRGSPLPPNGRIDFSEIGNSLDYTTSGWSVPQGEGTWTAGFRSALKIAGLPRRTKERLHICATAHLAGLQPPDVELCLNEHVIKRVHFTDQQTLTIEIGLPWLTKWRLRNMPVEISFNIKNPISPKALGASDDDRELGIVVHWIEIV